jgi:hypothetical protein
MVALAMLLLTSHTHSLSLSLSLWQTRKQPQKARERRCPLGSYSQWENSKHSRLLPQRTDGGLLSSDSWVAQSKYTFSWTANAPSVSLYKCTYCTVVTRVHYTRDWVENNVELPTVVVHTHTLTHHFRTPPTELRTTLHFTLYYVTTNTNLSQNFICSCLLQLLF